MNNLSLKMKKTYLKANLKYIFSLQFAFILLLSSAFSKDIHTTILISLDGFRYDYTERGFNSTLKDVAKEGVYAAYLQPVFPSSTFPNHISIITGLYPGNHGIVANNFFDYKKNEQYSIGKPEATNSSWYLGEAFWETCRKNNVIAASYFWPSSENADEKRRPNYYHPYEHKRDYLERVNGVLDWLKLPIGEQPKFITLYFDSPDSYGHNYGSNSRELNESNKALDSVLSYFFTELKNRKIFDSLNIIIVSDHGMTDLSKERTINLKQIIPDEYATIINNSVYAFIQPKEGFNQKVYELLKQNQNYYEVYKKSEIPQRYHYKNNDRISDIFVIADCGWLFLTDRPFSDKYVATHGYDNRCMDMQATFMAIGPDFKKSYRINGLRNIDIYPLLCELYGFEIDHKIDGDLQEIIHILK